MHTDELRPEGSRVVPPEQNAINRARMELRRAKERAASIKAGTYRPRGFAVNKDKINRNGRPKGIINSVTEYGETYRRLNEERIASGLPALTSATEMLIQAMNDKSVSVEDKIKIAEKLVNFEASRAPQVSVEHVQQVTQEANKVDNADEALQDFLMGLQTKETS